MIIKHYGKEYPIEVLRKYSYITKDGVSLLGISEASENLGFKTVAGKLSLKELVNKNSLPCILHWNQNHFVVLHKIKKK